MDTTVNTVYPIEYAHAFIAICLVVVIIISKRFMSYYDSRQVYVTGILAIIWFTIQVTTRDTNRIFN